MDPRKILISNYSYTLPENKIASYPAPERDASKLLIYQHGSIIEDIYRHIHKYLPENALLVFNNTKVIEARLLFQKPSGGVIEIFCLEPGIQYADITTGMLQRGNVEWKCLVGGASKWRPGQVLQKTITQHHGDITLQARYAGKEKDAFIIVLQWEPAEISFAEVLHAAGVIPLPPYIKRAAATTDADRYQTTYALRDGSVAAPTAGLHFTPVIFQQLASKDIQPAFVTLHVGAGTFKPVKSNTMGEHEMHAEYIDVTKETVAQLRLFYPVVYAVGTTSARTLETLYWMGVKTIINPAIRPADLLLEQWEVYDQLQTHAVEAPVALNSLLSWMEMHQLDRILSKTQLLIVPGYDFKIIRGLVTNLHQPQSTLLLLVAAIAGPNWQEIYSYALDNDFRFLSYGDGCLILRG